MMEISIKLDHAEDDTTWRERVRFLRRETTAAERRRAQHVTHWLSRLINGPH